MKLFVILLANGFKLTVKTGNFCNRLDVGSVGELRGNIRAKLAKYVSLGHPLTH